MAILQALVLLSQMPWRSRWRRRVLSFCLILGFMAAFLCHPPAQGQEKAEILWDSWGVPHIFAPDERSLFRAFGWAQAQSHGALLLKLYGEARGRASEYWGIEGLSNDQYVRLMGIPDRAQEWYQRQSPEMKRNLDAFAEGVTTYLQRHPQGLPDYAGAVLPITGADILALTQKTLWFEFLINPRQVEALKRREPAPTPETGSNAWAIAPSQTRNGKALLLANPHTPWGGAFRWTEAQLAAPGLNLSGAAPVGLPLLALGFNDHLGWSLTVNHPHNVGIYELALEKGGYRWDGAVKPFVTHRERLKIRQADGGFQILEWDRQESEAGIVAAQQSGRAYALQIPGLNRPQVLDQFLEMGKAKNLAQFEDAWRRGQTPLFNALYGDTQGNIFYLYNALMPRREGTWQDWGQPRPLDRSQDLPQDYLTYDELPRLTNPPNGWLQNSNDPPWTSAVPSPFKPEHYLPSLAAPNLGLAPNLLRTQRSLKQLLEGGPWDLERLQKAQFSSRLELADRLLPLLLPAAKLLANPLGLEAAEVLKAWDRQAAPTSRGAVLFFFWASTLERQTLFSKPWNPTDPLNTPAGLRDINQALAVLEGVAAQVKLLYGSLDISWGEVAQMQAGARRQPASGAPGDLGSFRVLQFKTTPQQKLEAWFGDSFIQIVEFSDPPQGQSVLVYGNSSQPGSPHNGDQLELYAQDRLRPVWRTPQEIGAHLEKREVF